jgi:hypothetical protein
MVSDILEHTTSSEICDVRRRDAGLDVAFAFLIPPRPKPDKLLWIRIGQWTKQYRCNEAENSSVSTNTECQRQDRYCGETWTLGQQRKP